MSGANGGPRLDNLLRHIAHVRENCLLLGEKLMASGKEHLGVSLVANGHLHDNSKFRGIEWEYLNDGAWPFPDGDPRKELFLTAQRQHVTTNPHHPECHGGIAHMSPLFLHEMVADWAARSSEQGTDLAEWVAHRATDRFRFSTKSRVYRDLRRIMLILLERKFS